MKRKEIEDVLKKTSALRADREAAADLMGSDPEHLRRLLEISGAKDSGLQIRACWILEILILRDPGLLHTVQGPFLSAIDGVSHASGIRPLAKIISLWCAAAFSAHTTPFPSLEPPQADQLAERCFAWLLEDHPTAVQAYSMEALYHLGKQEGWIHPELKAFLLAAYPKGSPGFKARARKILKRL